MRAELPILSFTCVLLLLLVTPGRWKSSDVAICSTIIWLLASNFIHGVNAVLWSDNVDNPSPAWCDITSKVTFGAPLGVAAASFCIARRLEFISSCRESFGGVRNRILVECMLCIVLPCIYMALHVIVQDRRFDIIEDVGCEVATYSSVPSVLVVWLPPLILSMGSAVYFVMAFIHYLRRSTSVGFSQHIYSRSTLTQPFYDSLLALIISDSLSIIAVYLACLIMTPIKEWTSIDAVHRLLGQPRVVTPMSVTEGERVQRILLWWMIPILSIVVSAFLAFSADARKRYPSLVTVFFNWIMSPDDQDLIIDVRANGPSPSLSQVHLLQSGWDDEWWSRQSKKTSVVFSDLERLTPSPPLSQNESLFPTVPEAEHRRTSAIRPLLLPLHIITPPSPTHLSIQSSPSASRSNSPSETSPVPCATLPALVVSELDARDKSGSIRSSRSSALLVESWPSPPTTIPPSPSLSDIAYEDLSSSDHSHGG